MARDIRNISRLATKSSLVVGIAAIAASGSAQAAVLISSAATANIACVSGVCTPTKKTAVLNVTQLQSLLASGNVTVTTAGPKSSNIVVSANLSWASGNSLTLDAYQSIIIDKAVSVNGTGPLTLTTNDGGTGGMLSFGKNGHVAFLSTANSLTINGAAYTLVADTITLASDITANANGYYALAASYNATADGTYTSSPVPTVFNGSFNGLGNTISNLTITSSSQYVGLFADVGSGGIIANVTLAKAVIFLNDALPNANSDVGALVGFNQGLLEDDSVSGSVRGRLSKPSRSTEAFLAGGLVGYNEYGSIVASHSSARVIGDDNGNAPDSAIGGLVGASYSGPINESYATGAVTGSGRNDAGGLVGYSAGETIANSYAIGPVGTGSGNAGGLVGANTSSTIHSGSGGTIISSYSTGSVTAGSGSYIGGLVGVESTADPDSYCYWDTTTSGITNPSQGAGSPINDPGITGLSNTQLQAGLPAGFSSTIWGENSSINGGLPYLLALPPPG